MQNKIRVLLIDDDVAFANSLSDILIEKGYEVCVVHTGEAALSKVKEGTFDVALLDIRLPVMNGVEVFKKLKKISPKTVVIMMTGYSVEDLIKSALDEGAYGVMYKPLDIDKTIHMIERAHHHGGLILLVDDDTLFRDSLQGVLEQKGYSVAVACDGEEAITIVRERTIDIVLIDLKLPVLNGLDTYLAIKKINPHIVAVMITGFREDMKALINLASEKGAYACIYKPFSPNELLKIIDEIDQKRQD